MGYLTLKKELKKLANPQKAKDLSWFFKTGKGDYGEGDVFLGLVSEQIKNIAKKVFIQTTREDLQNLLDSKIHEERMLALKILVLQFKKGTEKEKQLIYNFYLKNTKKINSWDLVDVSAPKIIGEYLLNKEKKILYKLATSKNLWERRIAALATFTFIKNNKFNDSLQISKILLNDSHDLMHKAVGWMLGEIGKKNLAEEEKFLKDHYKVMPRVMLRYSIEKFPEKKRLAYLKKNI